MFEGRPWGRSENPFCAPAQAQGVQVWTAELLWRLALQSKPRIIMTPHSLARVRSSGWSHWRGLRRVLRKEKGKAGIRDQQVATLRRLFDVISPGETLLTRPGGRSPKFMSDQKTFGTNVALFLPIIS